MPDLQFLIVLIRDFVEHRISADEFESRYLTAFKAGTGDVADDDIFETLDGLFADVDAYVADPTLRTDPEDLDEEQLRACAARVLEKLVPPGNAGL